MNSEEIDELLVQATIINKEGSDIHLTSLWKYSPEFILTINQDELIKILFDESHYIHGKKIWNTKWTPINLPRERVNGYTNYDTKEPILFKTHEGIRGTGYIKKWNMYSYV